MDKIESLQNLLDPKKNAVIEHQTPRKKLGELFLEDYWVQGGDCFL